MPCSHASASTNNDSIRETENGVYGVHVHTVVEDGLARLRWIVCVTISDTNCYRRRV